MKNLSTGTEASATWEALNSVDPAVLPAARHSPYACVLLIPLLVLLLVSLLLLLYEYRDLPLLLLHAAAVAVVTLHITAAGVVSVAIAAILTGAVLLI